MRKIKDLFKATLACGLAIFLLEGTFYMVFSDLYGRSFGSIINAAGAMDVALKLAAASLLTAFLASISYMAVAGSLPGGRARKAINFAFIMLALGAVPVMLQFYVGTAERFDFYLPFMVKYVVMDLAVSFCLAWIYDGPAADNAVKQEEKHEN